MDISIRELKANPGAAIKRVQAGERVRITAHRKVVAELVAPQPPERAPASDLPSTFPMPSDAEREADKAAIARLVASGLITQPATLPFRLPKPVRIPPGPDGQTMSDLVIELRGPR